MTDNPCGLPDAVAALEAGDTAAWEEIATFLIECLFQESGRVDLTAETRLDEFDDIATTISAAEDRFLMLSRLPEGERYSTVGELAARIFELSRPSESEPDMGHLS